MSGFDWQTASAPIDELVILPSVIGSQLLPPSVVFHAPPPVAPNQYSFGPGVAAAGRNGSAATRGPDAAPAHAAVEARIDGAARLRRSAAHTQVQAVPARAAADRRQDDDRLKVVMRLSEWKTRLVRLRRSFSLAQRRPRLVLVVNGQRCRSRASTAMPSDVQQEDAHPPDERQGHARGAAEPDAVVRSSPSPSHLRRAGMGRT